MATVTGYFSILQIKPGASIAEIKAAYRKRAKELHPDRNTSPTAHQDFILLTEAYEYLSANPNATETSYSSAHQQPPGYQQQQARQRAATYANMQYSDFVQSDFYRETEAMVVIAHHVAVLFAVLAMLGLFVVFVIVLGPAVGGIASLLIAAFAIPLLTKLVPANGPLGFSLLGKSLLLITKSRWLPALLIGVFNCYVFLAIGLQTLVPFSLLWQLYLLLTLITLGLFKGVIKPTGRFRAYFFSFFVAPLLFSLFLTLNYMFSHSPVNEKYEYAMGSENTRQGQQSTTLIQLPDDSYSQFPGLRVFLDYEQMQGTTTITYTFEKGLFGIPVMKDYRFE
ncbi:MAG TPA: J domain-containing protein [Chitinophagales bacterium]|nr:J domain-containing protein [Chitinophagales bacterium]